MNLTIMPQANFVGASLIPGENFELFENEGIYAMEAVKS